MQEAHHVESEQLSSKPRLLLNQTQGPDLFYTRHLIQHLELQKPETFPDQRQGVWVYGGLSPHQKRCPHRLITASLAVSKQMLHSKVLSWLALSPAPLLLLLPLVPPVLELFVDVEVVDPLLAILKNHSDPRSEIFSSWNPGSDKGGKKKIQTMSWHSNTAFLSCSTLAVIYLRST